MSIMFGAGNGTGAGSGGSGGAEVSAQGTNLTKNIIETMIKCVPSVVGVVFDETFLLVILDRWKLQ